MTVTKRDLVLRISEITKFKQQMVQQVIQMTLDNIAGALARGEKVELRNFGVFEIRARKARIGRNPQEPGKDVPIPTRAVVKFKPGKELRGEVRKLPPPVKPPPKPSVPPV
jgi:DNA-binding protein HU-beta/integration host factor subunit alpha